MKNKRKSIHVIHHFNRLKKKKMHDYINECRKFSKIDGNISHLLLGIMAALRPVMKHKNIKKRSKKFIWHQLDRHVKIK